MGKSVSRVLY